MDIGEQFSAEIYRSGTSQAADETEKDVKGAKEIYFATDPDQRGGEAIGWNLVEHIVDGKRKFTVSRFRRSPGRGLEAFKHPREFDRKKIDAQVARRILDRIVGYGISPLLWKKVGSRMSAGRVQSVALRIIVEREPRRSKFCPQGYWRDHR